MLLGRWVPALIVITLLTALGPGVTARSQITKLPRRMSQMPNQIPGQLSDQLPGQVPGQMPGELPPIDGGRPSDEDNAITRKIQAKQAVKRNEDRQAQLVKDTNRLLDLAKELKAEVDKTNQDVLSVDVVKKTDEIQKLAKSVHDKMKAN